MSNTCACALVPDDPLPPASSLPPLCCVAPAAEVQQAAALRDGLNRSVCRSVVLKLLTEKPSPIIITGKRRGCLSFLSYLLVWCVVRCEDLCSLL